MSPESCFFFLSTLKIWGKTWNTDPCEGLLGSHGFACWCAVKAASISSLLSSRSYKCCLPGHQLGSPRNFVSPRDYSAFILQKRIALSKQKTLNIYDPNLSSELILCSSSIWFGENIVQSWTSRPDVIHVGRNKCRINKIKNNTGPIHENVVQPGDDFKDKFYSNCALATKLKLR
jgi:hypothetical protein